MNNFGIYLETEMVKNSKGEEVLSITFQFDTKRKRLLRLDLFLVGGVHLLVYGGMFQALVGNLMMVIGLSLLFSGFITLLNYQNIHYFIEMLILNTLTLEVNEEEEDESIKAEAVLKAMKASLKEFKWVSLKTGLVTVSEMAIIFAAIPFNPIYLVALVLTAWKGITLYFIWKRHLSQKRILQAVRDRIDQ